MLSKDSKLVQHFFKELPPAHRKRSWFLSLLRYKLTTRRSSQPLTIPCAQSAGSFRQDMRYPRLWRTAVNGGRRFEAN